MWSNILAYAKVHSHAILMAIVLIQNLHVLNGTAGAVLNVIINGVASLSAN
jgi:hypothetical protein